MRMHRVRTSKAGTGARTTADSFVVLHIIIAEREIVHGAL